MGDKREKEQSGYRRKTIHAAVRFLAAAWIVCLFLSMVLTPLAVSASEQKAGAEAFPRPDSSRIGSITVEMRYNDRKVYGGTLKAYQVGQIVEYETEEGAPGYKFDWTDTFADFEGKPDSAQPADLARGLAAYIQKLEEGEEDKEDNTKEKESDKLDGARHIEENTDGKIVFKDLPAGLYLIVQSEATQGYEPLSPFLVSVPMVENGDYVYDVTAHGKFALIAVPTPVPTPVPTQAPTQTPVPDPTPIPGPTPVPTQAPTQTPVPGPTQTPIPGQTPVPTQTPTPGQTPVPTQTPIPGQTPGPTQTPILGQTPAPTQTPEPGQTPGPTQTPEPGQTPVPGQTPAPDPNPDPDPIPDSDPDQDPASDPGPERPVEKLPQTGQTNWPVPVLAVSGAAMILFGMTLRKDLRKKGSAIAKTGTASTIAGVLLMMAGLSLLLWNQQEAHAAEKMAETALEEVKEAIAGRREASAAEGRQETSEAEGQPEASEKAGRQEMSEVAGQSSDAVEEIDGYEYIGYISVPSLQLELPVMAQWDYTRLKTAPCRYYGSVGEDDLVIAAHNYAKHFGSLSTLEREDEVFFTDMEGVIHRYEVDAVDVLAPEAVEEMTGSGYDLTLFTCTYSGSSRVTVRCLRRDGE